MEKLTIQQLAPYLPYGLKFEYEGGICELHEGNIGKMVNYGKPILYPISCLTKTIQHGNESFVPLVKLFELCIDSIYGHIPKHTIKMIDNEDDTFGMVSVFNESRNRCGFTLNIERSLYDEKTCWFEYNLTIDGDKMKINQYQLFQKLAEWHINFLGIPEHLIIDKETLK